MAEDNNYMTTTYGNGENNGAKNYGNSEAQNTTAYQLKQDETNVYSDLQKKEFKSKNHNIKVGDKIILKGNEYLIVEIISEGTGEATIFKIEDNSKNVYALKLYFEFTNYKEEPNNDTLQRIKEIKDPNILRLYDFGVGADKYLEKHCFEISDFAKGGNLFSVTNFKEKYNQEFIEKHVIKEIYFGIKKLHENKIYHCDLKPQNVFYLDNIQTDLVIGDYGSAKAYDLEIEKEFRKSTIVKGTDAYLPPEQARGIISEKNDYYSFGMILLNLIYPDQLTKDNSTQQIDYEKLNKIVERQYNSQPVIDFDPTYKRLNKLIEGLTLINHLNRFGKNEAEKWLNGEEVEVKYAATETSSVQSVKLGYATIKTEKDFIEILETRSTWWEDLFEEVDTYFAIKAWLGSYHDIQSRKIFDDMVHYYKPYGKDFVKDATIRYFQPERDIKIDMTLFNFFTTKNINDEVKKYISKLDDIYAITSFEKIRFYLFQLEFSLKQVSLKIDGEYLVLVNSIIGKISSVFDFISENSDSRKTQIQDRFFKKNEKESYINLLELFYLFFPARTYKDTKNRKFDDIDEISLSYANDENLFIDKYCNAELTVYLKKRQLNHIQEESFLEFLFSVLQKHTKSNLNIEDVEFKDKEVRVVYRFNKSLTEFLSTKGIKKEVLIEGSNQSIVLSAKLITSNNELFNDVILSICKNHSVGKQSFEKESLNNAKSKVFTLLNSYKKEQRKKATFHTIGLIVYLIPIIVTLIGTIMVFTPSIFLEKLLQSLILLDVPIFLQTVGFLGWIYIAIIVSLIPAIIFWLVKSNYSKAEKPILNSNFNIREPPMLAALILGLILVCFFVVGIIFLVVKIVYIIGVILLIWFVIWIISQS